MRPIDLPPRKCPYCLVGACHRCTGRMVVLSGPREQRLDVPCEHVHRRGEVSAERVIADIPVRRRAATR